MLKELLSNAGVFINVPMSSYARFDTRSYRTVNLRVLLNLRQAELRVLEEAVHPLCIVEYNIVWLRKNS